MGGGAGGLREVWEVFIQFLNIWETKELNQEKKDFFFHILKKVYVDHFLESTIREMIYL